ncbi:MAG TPA: cysteine synthase family protein [Candidatus Hydrogenedentes bacterium]|nr:cysteine synthase family protein [Candidatus Hydrogenedentota bacterium]HNT88318.1 cysteine synthase family protein [Candidatus Hydrogenedentota bacterium]
MHGENATVSGAALLAHTHATGVIGAIGNTPLIELHRMSPNPRARILAKFEGANPGGSVKDRTAWYMVKQAEESGELHPGKTILEPTSGNTGIALAMIGALKGYHVKLMLPGCVSEERRRVLEAFGAEVEITCAREGTDGARRRAHEEFIEEPDKYYLPNQFANESNVLAHYETTGPEIYAQTGGQLDAFVAGMGTTGTLMGVSMCLKERSPRIQVVGVEPTLGHAIQGLKNLQESLVPEIYDPARLDDKITILDDDAFETTRRLAMQEGLFVGISSGASVAGAIQLAAHMDHGTIVTLLPDRGDRYLSTALFRSVCAKCPP